MSWPEFPHPTLLDGGRSWTARFESFDQRNDDCYYEITLSRAGAAESTVWACVSVLWSWNQAETEAHIREDLHRVAKSGVSNTKYTGSLVTKMSRR